MNTTKSLFMLSLAGTLAVGCGPREPTSAEIAAQAEAKGKAAAEEEARKNQIIGGKRYTIIDESIVGVTIEHDAASAFLTTGNPGSDKGDTRRSLYYIAEGAVATVMSAEQFTPFDPGRRAISNMYDYEKEEFARAVEFYTARAGEALRPVTAPAANDSVPKLQ